MFEKDMKRISTHTQTLNAIKAALGHHEDATLMLSHYLRTPHDAKYILRISGRPQHFYKNTCENCTVKLHNIL